MINLKPGVLVSILYLICFLSACGGSLDLVLPSSTTYQVNAYINEYSLNEYSIIRQNDTIRPYFAQSVAHDPDIRGLMVFLQTSGGQIVGKKTQYILNIPEQSHVEDQESQVSVEPEPVSEAPSVEPEVVPEPEPPVNPDPEVLVESQVPEVVAEARPEEEPVPEAPIPTEPEAIPETPVITEPEISSEPTESDKTLAETPPAPMPISPPQPPIVTESQDWGEDRLITITYLDRELPSFKLTETIAIGQYLMIFQVLGERGVLYKLERPVFFLGNAELNFDDIQRYLPGTTTSSHLVPPGTNILFEAQVFSDARLDPYMIWYNGKKRIGEGKLSEGANQLIWKTPEQTGFHGIKVAVFPFYPNEKVDIYGKVKELSLPVSSKSKNLGYFSGKADQFRYWYQFQSNLLDSKVPTDTERSLRPKGNQTPRWLPHGGMYGLAVGPKDIYLLPNTLFVLSKEEQGTGQIVFHIVPLADGTIFEGIFQISDESSRISSDMMTLNLSLVSRTLILTLHQRNGSYQESISLESLTDDFITASINFEIKRNHCTVDMYLENTTMKTEPQTLVLGGFLNGVGTFQIGSDKTQDNSKTSITNTVVIFDELGISFTKTPLLPESVPLESEGEFTVSEEIIKESKQSEST